MSSKFYAVKIGRKAGIYNTWNEAQAQVKGYNGAIFKSFKTLEQAQEYLTCLDVSNLKKDNTPEKINQEIDDLIKNIPNDTAIAFVDGSYSKVDTMYSFGAVLITSEIEEEVYDSFNDKNKVSSMNVAGEIEGVMQAIKWAISKNKSKIIIFYDYEGIEKWATGVWKANKPVSIDYKEFINDVSDKINIEFNHTRAHTGIIYNEKVDKLAKKALGLL